MKVPEDGIHLVGGLLEGAQGSWTADPNGGIIKSGTFLYVTDAVPVLTGDGLRINDVGVYDQASQRWLPVRRNQFRSDGTAYAYAEPYKANPTDSLENSTRVHVVSVLDRSDRVIYSGAPRAVVAFESDGVYVTAVRYYSGEGGSGLWRLDPSSGAATQIPNVQAGWIETVVNGTAWTDGGTIMPRGLLRLDLASGSQQTWANVGDEGWIWFVGLDSNGHPLVVEYPIPASAAPSVLYVYATPTTRVAITNVAFRQLSLTDGHGTWLAGEDGVYLLDANDKLVKVSDVTGGTLAGTCN